MERGMVVGGLMICGSFLLAVTLNRSAVEEHPAAEPPAAAAPISQPLIAAPAEDEPKPACATGVNGAGEPAAGDVPRQGDLPGNGRKACSQ